MAKGAYFNAMLRYNPSILPVCALALVLAACAFSGDQTAWDDINYNEIACDSPEDGSKTACTSTSSSLLSIGSGRGR